jgi:hypothetical protein
MLCSVETLNDGLYLLDCGFDFQVIIVCLRLDSHQLLLYHS